MNGSTPDSEQLKEELEKLRLAKEVLAAERELELEAQRVTAERQAEADELAREIALQEAEKERIAEEHARYVAAQQQDQIRAQHQAEYREYKKHSWKVGSRYGAFCGGVFGVIFWVPMDSNLVTLIASVIWFSLVGIFVGIILERFSAFRRFKKRP